MEIKTTFDVTIEDAVLTFALPTFPEVYGIEDNKDPTFHVKRVLSWLRDIKGLTLAGKSVTVEDIRDLNKMPTQFLNMIVEAWNQQLPRAKSNEASPEKKESTAI